MPWSKVNKIPQPVFPNQRDDEKVFVIVKKHFVGYIPTIGLIFFIAILFALIIRVIFSAAGGSLGLGGVGAMPYLITVAVAFFLVIALFVISTWIVHYYNFFIVTDRRLVEIIQKGLFNREINELTFDQVQDVGFKVCGVLNTFFDAGDIEIQTAGSSRNFLIKTIPRPNISAEILLDLIDQCKGSVESCKRMPKLRTVGLLDSKLIYRESIKPPVMNFNQDLKDSEQKFFRKKLRRARSLRELLDNWWIIHTNPMAATFGDVGFEKNKRWEKRQEGEKGE